ncbi:M23 family metallopeptidase [Streptomyces zhihengii]
MAAPGRGRLQRGGRRLRGSCPARPAGPAARRGVGGAGGALRAVRRLREYRRPLGTRAHRPGLRRRHRDPGAVGGPGVVESVACGGAFGIQVVVRHDNGYYTQYAHLAGVGVDQGERVRGGQWIGQAGTTGNSTGPHLHFEVRLTPDLGSGVDPAVWLAEHGVRL